MKPHSSAGLSWDCGVAPRLCGQTPEGGRELSESVLVHGLPGRAAGATLDLTEAWGLTGLCAAGGYSLGLFELLGFRIENVICVCGGRAWVPSCRSMAPTASHPLETLPQRFGATDCPSKARYTLSGPPSRLTPIFI